MRISAQASWLHGPGQCTSLFSRSDPTCLDGSPAPGSCHPMFTQWLGGSCSRAPTAVWDRLGSAGFFGLCGRGPEWPNSFACGAVPTSWGNLGHKHPLGITPTHYPLPPQTPRYYPLTPYHPLVPRTTPRYCEYLPIATTGLFVVETRKFRTLI